MLSLSENPRMLFKGDKICKGWARQLHIIKAETINLREIRNLLIKDRKKEELEMEPEAEFKVWKYNIIGPDQY